MKRLNIYLAGACKGLVDEGTSWRNEAFERFILAQKYLDLIAYHLYDPTEYFPKGNVLFAKDLYQIICDIFEKYHLNRLCWSCIADNPAIRGYRNFIKEHGGRECAYHKQICKLMDGKLHDDVEFEILAEEFRK